MAALGDELGVTWREGGAEVQLITDDGVRTVTTAYALSREGPHHVELVQSIEGTLWTVTAPGHAHHLGYWVDDVVAASAALVDQGSRRIATIAMTDEAPPMCAYLRTPNGLCVEIVNRGLRAGAAPDGGHGT